MNRLKEIRTRCALSGQGLAVKARLSTATVTGIERWDYLPTAVTRERIAQALQVSERDIWPDLELRPIQLDGVRKENANC